MFKKQPITIKKALELEKWLFNNYPIIIGDEELVTYFISNGFNQEEVQYLIEAYYLPLNEIKKEVEKFDNQKPEINILEFVKELQKKYNIDKKTATKRIQYARKSYSYLQEKEINYSDIKTFNKLVRDKIPNIIESKGEIAIYNTVSGEDYWNYLLKKDKEESEELAQAKNIHDIKEELADKLEVLRAMAIYHNLTLDDIIKEADKKKAEKGSFTKGLILKKTYKK